MQTILSRDCNLGKANRTEGKTLIYLVLAVLIMLGNLYVFLLFRLARSHLRGLWSFSYTYGKSKFFHEKLILLKIGVLQIRRVWDDKLGILSCGAKARKIDV